MCSLFHFCVSSKLQDVIALPTTISQLMIRVASFSLSDNTCISIDNASSTEVLICRVNVSTKDGRDGWGAGRWGLKNGGFPRIKTRRNTLKQYTMITEVNLLPPDAETYTWQILGCVHVCANQSLTAVVDGHRKNKALPTTPFPTPG